MRGSAFRLSPHMAACGALPLMTHPQRSLILPRVKGSVNEIVMFCLRQGAR
jgi:hypothetical protein